MWNTTRRFATDAKAAGAPLKFTYFISGVYYVGKANKRRYIEPTRGPGASAIGWGSDDEDLLTRYDQTNLAFKEGHEIASHANGHFSGDKWGFKEWQSEFRQSKTLVTAMPHLLLQKRITGPKNTRAEDTGTFLLRR
jgi:hypothetical protein